MLLIACPYCATSRPESEFRYAGQAGLARPVDGDARAWSEFLYFRDNPRGRHAERWRHSHGCGRFFNAVRDTVSDRFRATYRADEAPPPGCGLDADAP